MPTLPLLQSQHKLFWHSVLVLTLFISKVRAGASWQAPALNTPLDKARNNEDAIKEVEQQTATYRKQLTLGLLSIIVQSENVHDNVTSKATAGREQES